jgi:hypothetical protein|tara:strand:- start:1203 stop:1973 length:771 start_codon:yes stop_codon:yes gene_type:complete
MKKIISFSLWGDKPMYNVGAIRNADLASELYPDWTCRFYFGETTPQNTIDQLLVKNNTQMIQVKNATNDWSSTLWRFFAVDDSDVVIFRDTDSRLSEREKRAVDSWLNASQSVHIMRDHPEHTEKILAGMWGVKCQRFKETLQTDSFMNLCQSWLNTENRELANDEKGTDQEFLRYVYDRVYQDSFVNDTFPNRNPWSGRCSNPDGWLNNKHTEVNVGFSNPLTNFNMFVGQVFDENDNPNVDYGKRYEEYLEKTK